MGGEIGMTVEEAQSIKLPLSPIARHRVVMDMVHNPEIVGDDITVIVGVKDARRLDTNNLPNTTKLIGILPTNPFVGRRILVEVVEFANS